MTIPQVKAKLEALAAGIERDEPVGLHSRQYVPLILALLAEREAHTAWDRRTWQGDPEALVARLFAARARVAALLEAM